VLCMLCVSSAYEYYVYVSRVLCILPRCVRVCVCLSRCACSCFYVCCVCVCCMHVSWMCVLCVSYVCPSVGVVSVYISCRFVGFGMCGLLAYVYVVCVRLCV